MFIFMFMHVNCYYSLEGVVLKRSGPDDSVQNEVGTFLQEQTLSIQNHKCLFLPILQ